MHKYKSPFDKIGEAPQKLISGSMRRSISKFFYGLYVTYFLQTKTLCVKTFKLRQNDFIILKVLYIYV